MDNIDLLEHIEPQLPCASSPEPSLRSIVFGHYRAHFSYTEAVALTDKYFEELKKELRK